VPYRFAACSLAGPRYLVAWPVQAGPGNPEPVTPLMKQLALRFAVPGQPAVVVTVPRTWQVSRTQPEYPSPGE
jgi:hypothetical protein